MEEGKRERERERETKRKRERERERENSSCHDERKENYKEIREIEIEGNEEKKGSNEVRINAHCARTKIDGSRLLLANLDKL